MVLRVKKPDRTGLPNTNLYHAEQPSIAFFEEPV